jgi:hypothetical protein
MNIINVIKEELNFLNQGVADKYAEKQFNIPDPNVQMNAKAISGIPPEDNMGELVGVMKENIDVNIYLNPKNLQEFDDSVKAISTKDGDLFVAQMDGSFYHADIFNSINGYNKYKQHLSGAYEEDENVTWHRINNTNDFGFSVSYRGFGENVNNWSIVKPMLDAVKRMNPTFNFIPRYWQIIKQQRYDDTHDINNSDLNNYDEGEELNESKELNDYNNSILNELELNLNEHLNIEGVADKYAEKAFNIPDQNVQMDKRAIAGLGQDNSIGEVVGYITDYEYYEYSADNETIPIKVYLNPKTLNDFEVGVRAVSHDADGNLFVAQSDNSFYHSDLGNAVNKEGKYIIGRAYDVNENITWYRVGTLNKFRYSGTFTNHMASVNENKLLKALELVRSKNPQYEFVEDSVYQR